MISIVDDDPSVREMLVSLLRSFGYDARAFASGEEFLASEGLERCTCVITDIHMPAMSGFDLKQSLNERTLMLPVIMITALAETDLEDRAHSCGAIGLLRKPFDVQMLVDLIERAAGVQQS